MNKKIRIGIDVGGTNIEFCAVPSDVDKSSDLIFIHRAYPKGATLSELCTLLDGCITELSEKSGADVIINVGIATPGSLDVQRGVIIHAYNLGLSDAHIVECMRERRDADFHLINDADAAALGEFKFGALKGVESGCMITLGTGVGAGLIIDGRLYRGGKKRGTELGHMTLDINGEKCTCGNRGCIETLCSGTYLTLAGRAAYGDDTITAKDVADRAKMGEERAVAVFSQYVENLSSALATYMTLLDPERIVLGGGVSLAGEFLFEPVRRRTAEKCFFSPTGEIVSARLGNKAGAIGAAFAE